MSGKTRRYKVLLLFILLLAAWMILFSIVEPERLVEKIGVENTYIVAFLLAVFGGLSTVTGTSFFVTVAAFASSGSNPVLLATFGGLGIFISDSIFFLIAKYGVRAFKEGTERVTTWLTERLKKMPVWGVLAFVYLYIGFTPLPNDILMIALAFYGMTYKRLAPVLVLGSFTVVLVTILLGRELFKLF